MNLSLPDKLYYSIGEVAKAFGVNTSLLRFWEKEFPIIAPKKNKKGDRFFTIEDVKHLKIIYHLVKEKGYTLEGARTVMDIEKNLPKKVEIITRLETVKADLLRLKELLDQEEDT